MKLYMKQKVFSWRDRFKVWDENGTERYSVEGEFLSWGKKLHVYDSRGDEAAFIQQKVFSFLPRYFVFTGGREAAEIVKEFTFFHPKYSISGPGWDVDGSFWEHDYEITDHGFLVVTIHKQWMTWGDCYELDIHNPDNELLALATVLAIDCVTAQQNNSAN